MRRMVVRAMVGEDAAPVKAIITFTGVFGYSRRRRKATLLRDIVIRSIFHFLRNERTKTIGRKRNDDNIMFWNARTGPWCRRRETRGSFWTFWSAEVTQRRAALLPGPRADDLAERTIIIIILSRTWKRGKKLVGTSSRAYIISLWMHTISMSIVRGVMYR